MNFEKEIMESDKLENNINQLSERYRKQTNYKKSIFKNLGEELIINSNNSLKNKYSQKSIFSPRSNSNIKLKKIYNPYLITACKHAIIREKRELPNYKEIIRNINTEFGIEEEKQNINFKKNKNLLTINVDSNCKR